MRNRRRWGRLVRRGSVALLVALILALVPCPVWTPEVFTWWQVPVIIVVLICYLGSLLFDTFFFDRYR